MRKSTKKGKKRMIMIIIIVILAVFSSLGTWFGFPWEHVIANSIAQKYIMDNYELTPIKSTTLIRIEGIIIVRIWTKELDFATNVYLHRTFFKIDRDDVIEDLATYILEEDLKNYVSKKTNGQGHARIIIFSAIHNEFTVFELRNNPQLAFEVLKDKYRCVIYINDDTSINNYELLYDIYKNVFYIGLQPTVITFNYTTEEKSILSIRIDKIHYPDINSPQDLKTIFEEEMNM